MILIPEVMVWQQRSVELRTLKLIRKELKKEGMAVILEANGSVCRNYFHLFVQKAWNLQLRKRQPLLANSFWCVRCCDSSQMAWEMRIRVGKPAGVGRKGLLLNPKTFLTHSLGRFALFSEIPAGICWGWSGGRGGDLSRREREIREAQNIRRLAGAALCALTWGMAVALPRQHSLSLLGSEHWIFSCFSEATLPAQDSPRWSTGTLCVSPGSPCHAFPACGNALNREQGHPNFHSFKQQQKEV